MAIQFLLRVLWQVFWLLLHTTLLHPIYTITNFNWLRLFQTPRKMHLKMIDKWPRGAATFQVHFTVRRVDEGDSNEVAYDLSTLKSSWKYLPEITELTLEHYHGNRIQNGVQLTPDYYEEVWKMLSQLDGLTKLHVNTCDRTDLIDLSDAGEKLYTQMVCSLIEHCHKTLKHIHGLHWASSEVYRVVKLCSCVHQVQINNNQILADPMQAVAVLQDYPLQAGVTNAFSFKLGFNDQPSLVQYLNSLPYNTQNRDPVQRAVIFELTIHFDLDDAFVSELQPNRLNALHQLTINPRSPNEDTMNNDRLLHFIGRLIGEFSPLLDQITIVSEPHDFILPFIDLALNNRMKNAYRFPWESRLAVEGPNQNLKVSLQSIFNRDKFKCEEKRLDAEYLEPKNKGDMENRFQWKLVIWDTHTHVNIEIFGWH